MADCCRVRASPIADIERCPVSRSKGKPVDLLTVKALLTESALRRINNSAYRFCPEPSCEVVYFDTGGAAYMKHELRVPVWQKEPFGDRTVCYCFGVSEESIRAEIQTKGRSEATERVRAHIAAGRCACQVRNPRGACCLGDVAAAVKRVDTALQHAAAYAGARTRRGDREQGERSLLEPTEAECSIVEQLGRSQG